MLDYRKNKVVLVLTLILFFSTQIPSLFHYEIDKSLEAFAYITIWIVLGIAGLTDIQSDKRYIKFGGYLLIISAIVFSTLQLLSL